MQWIRQWIDSVLSLDGTLGKKQQQQRTLFFAFNSACLAAIIAYPCVMYKAMVSQVHIFAYVVLLAGGVIGVVSILCRYNLSSPLVLSVAYCYACGVLITDLVERTTMSYMWPCLVLIVDLLLVMQVPPRHTIGLVCFTITYLVVIALEEGFRFGLFDLPGLIPQEGTFGRKEVFRALTACNAPPCPRDTSLTVLNALTVFLCDFIVTRGFARSVLRQQAWMEQTINTVQEIASLLAGYDVEMVAQLLEAHEHELPEGMTTALRSLEENLRVYKPYLPQTCLPFRRETLSDLGERDLSSIIEPQSPKMTPCCPLLKPLGLSSIKATLLTLNIKDTLHRLEEDTVSFSDLFTSVLLETLQATEARRGMVDVFIGDRIHCSFNTSKICASHATSALHAATLLLRGGDAIAPHVNMGVATGTVLRGDMGCAVMRRFSMVGTLVRDVNVLERAGRVLGCSVLCNRLCFSDAECEHQMRLVPCKIELAVGCDAGLVAELVVSKDGVASEGSEWMYQIGGKKDWEEYNTVVRRFMRGECSTHEVVSAGKLGNCAHTPLNIRASISQWPHGNEHCTTSPVEVCSPIVETITFGEFGACDNV